MKKSLFVLSTVAGMATLLGTGLASAQAIYVTDFESDQLTVTGPGVTPETINNPSSQTFLDSPTGIAVDTDPSSSYYGDVFVANQTDDTIVTYDPATGTFANFAVGGDLSIPKGLAFDSNGDLYVANYGGGNIIQYSGASLTAVNTSYSTGLTAPVDVVATSTGQLYVTDNFATLQLVAPGGGSPSPFNPSLPLTTPSGIAVGPAGLYISNYGAPNVEQVQINGTGSIAVTGAANQFLSTPLGLAFDSSDNLYVADYGNNTVTEYEETGINLQGEITYSYLATYATGEEPAFLTFDPLGSQAVPEPGTYAMLLGGLAMLYVMQRRRTVALAKI